MQIGSFERHFKFWNWIQLRVGTIQVFLPNQESKQSENLNYINNFYYFRLLTVPIFMYPRKKLKCGLSFKKIKKKVWSLRNTWIHLIFLYIVLLFNFALAPFQSPLVIQGNFSLFLNQQLILACIKCSAFNFSHVLPDSRLKL